MSKRNRPTVVEPNEHASVSVRQIDNGFITSRSSYSGGEYKTSETFSKEKPKISLNASTGEAPKAMPRQKSCSSLSAAMKHLK